MRCWRRVKDATASGALAATISTLPRHHACLDMERAMRAWQSEVCRRPYALPERGSPLLRCLPSSRTSLLLSGSLLLLFDWCKSSCQNPIRTLAGIPELANLKEGRPDRPLGDAKANGELRISCAANLWQLGQPESLEEIISVNLPKCCLKQSCKVLRGPPTPYETKPHTKQHCCCTWQGHPLLAISTVVAAENLLKMTTIHVGCVSCRMTLWGEFVDPDVMKDREAVVSRWVCGFMLGLERILWWFLCCFVSGYVCDAWHIEIHCFENGRTPQVFLRSRPWRGLSKIRCFMSGWGFVSGLQVLLNKQRLSQTQILEWGPARAKASSMQLLRCHFDCDFSWAYPKPSKEASWL